MNYDTLLMEIRKKKFVIIPGRGTISDLYAKANFRKCF